jgi:hypothetical protein
LSRPKPDLFARRASRRSIKNKSLFASFSSEKEDSSLLFSEERKPKTSASCAAFEDQGLGRMDGAGSLAPPAQASGASRAETVDGAAELVKSSVRSAFTWDMPA